MVCCFFFLCWIRMLFVTKTTLWAFLVLFCSISKVLSLEFLYWISYKIINWSWNFNLYCLYIANLFLRTIKHSVLFFLSLLDQDVVCDKNNAPSVSSISRVLRGGHTDGCTSDEGRTNHSIDGILGKTLKQKFSKSAKNSHLL